MAIGADLPAASERAGRVRCSCDTVLISEDGQPSPTTRITWVSTPRFYRQESLIVLYVGCSDVVTRALAATVGTPIVVGRTPCVTGQ